MRAPVSWLRDFVTTSASADDFAAALTARGFTVDGVAPQPMPQHIVVGKVTTLERHPNADRLLVSSVDVGSQTLQIVTGATNVHAGDTVPIALVGAEVFERPGKDGGPAPATTKRIERSTLRGVESNGMMCSPDELALPGEYADGILIMESDATVGEDFWRAARFGDAVLDVDVPSNRPDCLSMIGLAREAAAGLRASLQLPELTQAAGDRPSPIAVEISDASVCRRLVGQYFSAITPRRSPMWMVLRLQAAGMRSINWLVDVSNYVQLETGQPLHFYDADLLRGGKIIARAARAGEPVTTLDGHERALPEGTPVIADGERLVGIAGIMGGVDSGVTEQTRNIFLESPNFVGPRIRRASIALGLRTEGALRHEKGLPLQLPEDGRRRAAQLLLETGAGASQVIAVGAQPQPQPSIEFRPERVNRLLGAQFSAAQMRDALTAIDIQVSGASPMSARVPYWRTDLREEVDITEEVARGIGYGDIPEVRVVAAPQAVDEGLFDQESVLAQQLAACGYREIVSLSLQGTRTVAAWERSGIAFWPHVESVVNPLSDEHRFLRPSLLPGLLQAASKGWPHGTALRLFEIGHVFRPLAGKAGAEDFWRGSYAQNGVIEWPSLAALAVFGDDAVGFPLDQRLLQTKGELEAALRKLEPGILSSQPQERAYFHPGAAGNMVGSEKVIAKFGRLQPQLSRAYGLPLTTYAFFLYLEHLPQHPPVRHYQALPKFPATRRDIAVVVDAATSSGDLGAAALSSGAPYVVSVQAFDEYRGRQLGADKKSVALSAVLRRPDATITDEEANASTSIIVAALAKHFGAKLRE
ncbi:MAG: phenylalanine--tRNA ligase subunit beta [Candidatus Eremiobacteraeota bacterium]|nr:phenylalanine--tRNA ligase subunit beta [Candidatus Eremiobacteraeota bacterium]